MTNKTNDPALKSWIDVPPNCDFPIQNLPFGIYSTNSKDRRVGVAIGEKILDLYFLNKNGYLNDLPFTEKDFNCDFLNNMMLHGKQNVSNLRARVSTLLSNDNNEIKNNENQLNQLFDNQDKAQMHLPVKIGDYTDFYSSEQHAYNVGCMFRDPNNALLPNWKHIPVGYHGRSSSIIVSGEPVIRPKGQQKLDNQENPVFGPCKLLDFELEMGFITFEGKPLGETISTDEADDYIFGMCLFNDWSARDIQKWEYVPLGPFLAKNFASSMSPWIVTIDALEPFRIPGPNQEPAVLPYLEYNGDKHLDINLEVAIKAPNQKEKIVSNSNYKHMYWNMNQQLAHHSINGCDIHCGDLLASGTISGPNEGSYGSMLEISWKGTKPVDMPDGTQRRFINDGDTVTMRGYSEKNGVRIGFGEVKSEILPSK
ncbi:MAG: fumarylacetoacetase [Crocinitomicaceae bacterium]|nr:fumarylacetoacetase [Crocinitomicaceae bacterium]|tara:strand:- start:10534 stop:11808 length:1275 start_codon:yes stop_codon:yes gene_type:complete